MESTVVAHPSTPKWKPRDHGAHPLPSRRIDIARAYGAAVWAVVDRDARVFLTYRTRLFSQVASLLLSMSIFYYVARLMDVRTTGGPAGYFAYVTVGIVIALVLQSTVSTGMLVQQELMAGTFERFLTSALGPAAGALAMTIFPMCMAIFLGTISILAAAALFSLPVAWGTAALAIPAAVLAGSAFASIGVLFIAGTVRFKQSLGATWVIALLSLTGGAYFPVKLLPDWLEWTSEVQPFTPAVNLIRHLLVGATPIEPLWLSVVKLLAFVAVLLPLSTLALRAAIRSARRRGVILEY